MPVLRAVDPAQSTAELLLFSFKNRITALSDAMDQVMATAADHDNLSCKEWVPLGQYLTQTLRDGPSPTQAKDFICQELYHERLPYRYRDDLGNLHENDLPNIFWLRAKIDFETSSATTHPDPRAELALMMYGEMPKGIEIFNIEVTTRQLMRRT